MIEWTEEKRLRFLLKIANDQLGGQADSLFLLERFLIGMEKHINADPDIDRFEMLDDISAALLMTQKLLRDADEARKGMLLQTADLSTFFVH